MQINNLLGAAIVLSVISSVSVFAQGKEPTAKDMYEAYAGYWTNVSINLKRTAAGCRSGTIKGFECLGMIASGITEVEVRAMDKLGCKVAPSGDGHNCTFRPEVKVTGTNDQMAKNLESSLNSPKENLFRVVSGKWVVFARTNQ